MSWVMTIVIAEAVAPHAAPERRAMPAYARILLPIRITAEVWDHKAHSLFVAPAPMANKKLAAIALAMIFLLILTIAANAGMLVPV